MLLAALLDAGADLAAVRGAVEAVLPAEVVVRTERVRRAGLSALRVVVEERGMPRARTWADLRGRLEEAALDARVRALALRAFTLLAEVEGRAHGVAVEEVHFHEVGAWDSVADVVGVAAAVVDLGVERVTCGPVGLGSGTVRTEHGVMPVPVPAVLGVLSGTRLRAAADPSLEGECATPTGVALLATLTDGAPAAGVPAGQVLAVGTGAGTRDVTTRANITRVVLHDDLPEDLPDHHGTPGTSGPGGGEPAVRVLVEVAATVDDLDPRVWPEVLAVLLEAGALDVWTTPVLMKKGRPGTVVTVLAEPALRERVVDVLLRHTPTLGVRWHEVHRLALERVWRTVDVLGGEVRVKIGHRDGQILTVTPELVDCRAAAARTSTPLRHVLRAAEAAAQASGWLTGAAI